MNPGKYRKDQQRYLPGAEERRTDSQDVNGLDVYHTGSGRVREEWLSRCREERALTNLTASLKRVISNAGNAGVDGMSVKELRD